ncbi:MAG: hypothetical protein IJK26_09440 [Clostridia bacterium]|nr:hypothetical protein [Clostridia bacterium]
MSTVYVCREENRKEIADVTGYIVSNVEVTSSLDTALTWYAEALKKGINDDFMPQGSPKTDYGYQTAKAALSEKDEFRTTMLGVNWKDSCKGNPDNSFDIVIERKEIKD